MQWSWGWTGGRIHVWNQIHMSRVDSPYGVWLQNHKKTVHSPNLTLHWLACCLQSPRKNEAFPQQAIVNAQAWDLEISDLSGSSDEPRPGELALVSRRFTVLGAVCPGSEALFQVCVSPPSSYSQNMLGQIHIHRGVMTLRIPPWGLCISADVLWNARCSLVRFLGL